MAPAQSKRQTRKRRKARPAPGAVVARPSRPNPERAVARHVDAREPNVLKAYGERPPSPFGGLPVSEMAIFAGAIGVAVGFLGSNHTALIVGAVVCGLGVLEFTVREHFSGYRSHTTLLAAIPPLAILVLAVALLGAPHERTARILLLLLTVPVFALLFPVLRKRFRAARQARVVRPPAP